MATLTKYYQYLGQQYIGTSGGNLYVRIYAKYSDQDIPNNRTLVQYQARSYYENSTYIYDAQGSIGVSGTGADYQSASCTRPTTGETISVTTEGWVTHNGDGTRDVSAAATINFPNWGWSGTAYGSASLPTIPRASTISSMSNVYIGENTTINVNRKSSSFTHTITYSFGNLSGTVVTKSSNTGVSWTIPESFYGQMTDTTQKNVTLYITTYSGNTQIGDRQSTTFTLRTRESVCRPDVDATIKDINQDTLALTGNELYLVKNYSTVEVTYTATPKNSASISQVDVNSRVMGTNPYTFTASESEKNEISVTAKDSRGYSSNKVFYPGELASTPLLRAGEQTPDPSIIPPGDYKYIDYISPTAKITVTRKAPTSDELLISFSGNYFNDTFGAVNNELELKWKYREYNPYNPTDWDEITAQTFTLGTDYVLKGYTYHSGNSADYENSISLGHVFDYQKNYEIQFIYSDKLYGNSVIALGTKGIPVVNWGEDFFNVNGDIRQYNKSILQPSACKMETYDYTSIGEDQTKTVDVWQEGYELGDYECDTLNNRLIIKNTSLCHIAGAIAGNGYLWTRIRVFEDGVSEQINEWGVLIQTYGNGYFCTPLQSPDVQLNPEKTYYVTLDISGYHQSFNLNAGFGPRATWISARKIY